MSASHTRAQLQTLSTLRTILRVVRTWDVRPAAGAARDPSEFLRLVMSRYRDSKAEKDRSTIKGLRSDAYEYVTYLKAAEEQTVRRRNLHKSCYARSFFRRRRRRHDRSGDFTR